MAKRFRDKNGKITHIECSASEMAKLLDSDVDQLLACPELVPTRRGQGPATIYRLKDEATRDLYRKRIALLKTNMSPAAIKNVEAAGLLDAYAGLAEDCPAGISAHVWRSYGLVVLIQIRYGKKIGPEELAQRAGIIKPDSKELDLKLAEKHIRLLIGMGYLREDDSSEWQGQWRHQGLPAAWVKNA